MTSKISFSKLCKLTIKEQTSLIFVSCVYALIGVFTAMFSLQRVLSPGYIDIESKFSLDECLAEIFCSDGASLAIMFSIVLAGLFAFATFRHLHSRTQSDFYGSLPITRKNQFLVLLVSNLIIYLIPLIGQYLLDTLAVAITGHLSILILKQILAAIILQVISFLLTWLTVLLAVIMTGHLFIGLLGTGVFLAYFPLVIRYLIPSYAGTFFNTYLDLDSDVFGVTKVLDYLSPVSISWRLFAQEDGLLWTLRSHLDILAIALAGILVLGALCLKLYEIRPAETAGNAMAFTKFNPILAVLLIVPAALWTGIFFSSFAYWHYKKFWIIPGTLFGVVVFSILIMSLFDCDIKAIFQHKRLFAISFAICALFVSYFWFDFGSYDDYLPSENEVEEIYFKFSGNFMFMDDTSIENSEVAAVFASKNGISGENLDKAYALAEYIASEGSDLNSEVISEMDDSNYDSVTIFYILKNHKTVYRHYWFKLDETNESFKEAYETEEFKDDYYPVLSLTADDIETIQFHDGYEYHYLNFDQATKEALVKAVKEDLLDLDYETYMTVNPVSELIMTIKDSSGKASTTVYIYPSFKRTDQLLKEEGFDACSSLLEKKVISKVIVNIYNSDKERDDTYTFSDPADIEILKPTISSFTIAPLSRERTYTDCIFAQIYTSSNIYIDGYVSQEGAEALNLL